MRAVVTPAPEKERDVVPDALQQATVDPLTASLLTVGTECRGLVPVFDGRRRYDLRLEELPPATVPWSRGALYAGSARRCRAIVEARAGFWRDDPRDSETPTTLDYWIASPGERLPPVPVYLELSGARGTLGDRPHEGARPGLAGWRRASHLLREACMVTVHGWVARGYEEVREAFGVNFARHDDVGAACAVYRDGRPVVDVWGLTDRQCVAARAGRGQQRAARVDRAATSRAPSGTSRTRRWPAADPALDDGRGLDPTRLAGGFPDVDSPPAFDTDPRSDALLRRAIRLAPGFEAVAQRMHVAVRPEAR